MGSLETLGAPPEAHRHSSVAQEGLGAGLGMIFWRILTSFWDPLELTFLLFWGVFLMSFFDMLLELIFVHFWIDFEVDFGAFFEHF